jgi:hypothetical protein
MISLHGTNVLIGGCLFRYRPYGNRIAELGMGDIRRLMLYVKLEKCDERAEESKYIYVYCWRSDLDRKGQMNTVLVLRMTINNQWLAFDGWCTMEEQFRVLVYRTHSE